MLNGFHVDVVCTHSMYTQYVHMLNGFHVDVVCTHSMYSVLTAHLLVDVGFGHEGVEDVEDTVDVPCLLVLPQALDLVCRACLQLSPELDKRLELQAPRQTDRQTDRQTNRQINRLGRGTGMVRSTTDLVNKLINDIPQPLVGQLYIDRLLCICGVKHNQQNLVVSILPC